MTQAERKFTVVNGKIISKNPLTPEEKVKWKTEQEEFDIQVLGGDKFENPFLGV